MMKTFLVVISLFTTAAFAGRPIKTVDAFPLGKKVFQVEFASDTYYQEKNYFLSLPAVFTYGFTDVTDIEMGMSLTTYNKKFVESVSAGFKQYLFASGNYEAAVASGFVTVIDNGNFHSPAGYINLVSSLNFESFVLHFNAGYSQNLNEGERRDLWFSSVGAEYSITDKLILAADAGLIRNTDFSINAPVLCSLAGFSYRLWENFSVDAGVNFCHSSNLVDLITTGFTAAF